MKKFNKITYPSISYNKEGDTLEIILEKPKEYFISYVHQDLDVLEVLDKKVSKVIGFRLWRASKYIKGTKK